MFNISKFNPCKKGLEWYKTQKSFKDAWNNCTRGDWMIWIAYRLKIDNRKLTLVKGKCAELVLHLMKDERSKAAVKAAIDYGEGRINNDEIKKAAAAAAAAYYAAYTAAYAAYDAYDAAYAAAAYAAYDAAYAASTAADAAAHAAYAAAHDNYTKTLNKCASICRKYLTEEVLKGVGAK